MDYYIPNYYNNFKCLKGNCKHTCCKGWEIDIDSDTYQLYLSVETDFRNTLLAGIDSTEDGHCFRLDEDERCPFLNSDGLCDIVLNLGFDSLSQICRDHPLYRNYLSDRCEIGLGLCCESAAELILNWDSPIMLFCSDSDSVPDILSPWDAFLLSLRNELITTVQNSSCSVLECVKQIMLSYNITLPSINSVVSFMKQLETMDSSWIQILDSANVESNKNLSNATEKNLENLFIYLLLRYLVQANNESEYLLYLKYCIAMFLLLYHLSFNTSIDFPELCRLFSSEIEYSDENPGLIMDFLSLS